MKVIVVGNQKGGVGKSTIACNLAVCAAVMHNKKVLIIDADPQGSSMEWREFRQKEDITVVSITTTAIRTEIQKFDNFDLIFVDAGGRDNSLFRAALLTAINGLLLIPCLAAGVDIWSTEDTFEILEEARAVGADIKAFVVFNQLKSRALLINEAKETLIELTANNNIILCDNCIGDREAFKQAFIQGKGAIEFAPGSKAAVEVMLLYNELIKRMEEV